MLIGAFAVILVAGVGLSVSFYAGVLPGALSSQPKTTVIAIPAGSYDEPAGGFNVTELLGNSYSYPFNFTVVVGSNNTIKWVNDDQVAHTVSSFLVPAGASAFNSDLIEPKASYSVTLTVPGVYKYTCIWHPWLAGIITVKS